MQFLTTITDDPYLDTADVAAANADYFAAAIQALAVVLLITLVVGVIQYVMGSWALGRVFQKTGVSAWKAWVPVYNYIILLIKGRLSPWLILLHFVPSVLAFIAMPGLATGAIGDDGLSIMDALSVLTAFGAYLPLLIAVHRINVGFGKGVGFTILSIFFPFVWSLIIGLGNSSWSVPQKARVTI